METLLETTVAAEAEGLRLSVRGDLSSDTVPALRSLVEALRDSRERVRLDLRRARIGPSASGGLERWGLTAAGIAGVYFVP